MAPDLLSGGPIITQLLQSRRVTRSASTSNQVVEKNINIEALAKQSSTENQVNWITALFMAAFHIGAICSFFFFTWKGLLVAALLWWVSGSLGIGMGYHRLLTHRGYKTPKWVEYFLTVCATLTLEGGPIFWVATHRIHHQFADKEGDPHSPVDGTWWAHMGWILTGKSMHHDTTTLAHYVPDLAKDKFHVWITRFHYVPMIVLGVLLTFGEGWHNNHHAHPTSSRHGLKWYEVDVNWYGIWTLKMLGLAKQIKTLELPKLERKVVSAT